VSVPGFMASSDRDSAFVSQVERLGGKDQSGFRLLGVGFQTCSAIYLCGPSREYARVSLALGYTLALMATETVERGCVLLENRRAL
jgi:hypothetical protein